MPSSTLITPPWLNPHRPNVGSLKHRLFIIIKTGIVPASAQKLKIISLLTRLLLEVGIFNDRLLAGLMGSLLKILCDCEWSAVVSDRLRGLFWGIVDHWDCVSSVRKVTKDSRLALVAVKSCTPYFLDSKQEAGLISIMPCRICLWTVRIAQRLTVTFREEHVVHNLFLAFWSKLTCCTWHLCY